MPSAEDIAKLTQTQTRMPPAVVEEAKQVIAEAVKLTPKTLGGLPVTRMADRRFDFLNMLLYGDPGVGKTTFIGTASEVAALCPVLLLNVEGGDLSLSGYPGIEVVRVTSYEQMTPIYNELYRELRKPNPPYKTVAIDNLTELRYFSMSDIMVDAVAANSNMDPDVPSQREWGKNSNQIRAVVRGFRDLPCHTILTSHAKEVEKSKVTVTKPALPGQLSDEISGFVDLVLYYYIKMVGANEHKRLMLTTKTATTNAKDRSGKLPPVIEEPNMEALIKLIMPHLTEKEDSK